MTKRWGDLPFFVVKNKNLIGAKNIHEKYGKKELFDL